MGGGLRKKYVKLVRGSVYDLTAMYIRLIVKQNVNDKVSMSICKTLADILNNGYTFTMLHKDIMTAFTHHRDLDLAKYKKPCSLNLIKQGVMYYHKELKIINQLPAVVHDIDAGTLTSVPTEFYVEPVASYTIEDLLKYFYSRTMADTAEFNPKRMSGLFSHMIDKYGLDKLLFMIEAAARMFDAEHKIFTLADFDSYSSTASHYLEEIKNSCTFSGEDKYVPKRRVLFD